MKEFTKLSFIRHGDPDRTKKVPRDELPLSEQSVEALITMKGKQGVPEEQSLGFTMNNKRSEETTNILVTSNKEPDKFKVKIDNGLQYKVDWNFFEFKSIAKIPKDKHNIFKEIVAFSDRVKESHGLDFTAYMDMVNKVRAILLKYKFVTVNWSKISEKYEDPGLYRFFCANEYFYPSFRAWMTGQILGDEEKQKYVDWYAEHFERNEERKHEECTITIATDPSNKTFFTMYDPFGTLTFNEDML